LRFYGGAEVQIPQRVEQRNEEHQQKNQGDESKKRLSPKRIIEPLGLQSDNFLMGFTKVCRLQRLANTLKPRVENVEAARHDCYHNEKNCIDSMTKTLIRHAVHEDFDVLLEIDEASFPRGVAYDANELAYFMDRSGSETIVVEEDGNIVAFLIVEVHRNRRSATIVTVDVRENSRRKGYGSQLLMRAEEMLHDYGIELYDLQVDVSNGKAILFYKKHGFTIARTLRNYYANGHDAYLMMKEL
jgi:ribosomal-protein-alanine N-acetyltransferase